MELQSVLIPQEEVRKYYLNLPVLSSQTVKSVIELLVKVKNNKDFVHVTYVFVFCLLVLSRGHHTKHLLICGTFFTFKQHKQQQIPTAAAYRVWDTWITLVSILRASSSLSKSCHLLLKISLKSFDVISLT